MSAIAQAQRNKDADLRRWSSTGHREARTKPAADASKRPSIVTFRSGHPPPNRQTQLAPTPQIIARIASGPVDPTSPRAQISIAPARHRPTSLTAVSFPGGFRTPAAGVSRIVPYAAGIRNPSHSDRTWQAANPAMSALPR